MLRGKTHRKALGAAVATCGLLLLVGLFVPLYTDEVGSKIQLTRAFADGNVMVWLLPQCRAGHITPLPLVWYPGAVVQTLAFGQLGLLGLRISGVVVAALAFSTGWSLCRHLGGGPSTQRARMALYVATQTAGLVPFSLVLARPESSLVLCLLLYANFAVCGWFTRRTTTTGRAVTLVSFVVLTSTFYFTHSKAVFFAPLVVTATWLTFGKRRVWLAAGLLSVLVIAGGSFLQTRRTAGCPESPHIQAFFDAVLTKPALAASDPAKFAGEVVANVVNAAAKSVDGMVLAPTYEAGWLPPAASRELPADVRAANLATRGVLYALQAACVLTSIGAVVIAIRRHSRRARRMVLFAGTLLVGLAGHLAFAKHWPFYHTPFFTAVVALLTLLTGSVVLAPVRAWSRRDTRLGRALGALVTTFVATALLSAAVTFGHLGPRLVALSTREGTSLPAQPTSVPAFHFAAERTRIRAHAARCGITGDGARHLVVDDATIFAFERLWRPFHLLYVSDASVWSSDKAGEKNIAFLREIGATGIIARCGYMPTALVSRMKEADGYCCVGADDLERR